MSQKKLVLSDYFNTMKTNDGFKKPEPKSLKKKSRKRSGGQPGHEGRTLQMSSNPDVIEILENKSCKDCGHSLINVFPSGYEKRQEYDIGIKVVVTEYRAEVSFDRRNNCPL